MRLELEGNPLTCIPIQIKSKGYKEVSGKKRKEKDRESNNLYYFVDTCVFEAATRGICCVGSYEGHACWSRGGMPLYIYFFICY